MSENMDQLYKVIKKAGYSYDAKQDIFYAHLNAWQRKMGYCRLYDEAAAALNMIIDCEPIYFDYDGQKWLIQLWKGQYALTTGCEIGVYKAVEGDLNIPNLFKGTFFISVNNDELLDMACTLKKNGEKLFTRAAKHWWLTGFKLGEFSEPSELTLTAKITLKDDKMCNAFLQGLQKVGYSDRDFRVNGNTVKVRFTNPHNPQPTTRTPQSDAVIQRNNKLLCQSYRDITGSYNNFLDKAKAISKQKPEIYEYLLNMGKSKELYEPYEKIQKLLGQQQLIIF